MNVKRGGSYALIAISLTLPSVWWLIVDMFFGGLFGFEWVIAASILIITIGIYVIARTIKHDGIRRWLFIFFYLIATLPIIAWIAVSGFYQMRILGRDYLFVEYGLFILFGILLMSLTVPLVLFAHIAYALSVRKLRKAESGGVCE